MCVYLSAKYCTYIMLICYGTTVDVLLSKLCFTTEKSRKMGLNSNAKKYSIPKPEKVEYLCLNNSCRRLNAGDDQDVTSANHITISNGSIDFYIKNFVQVCRLNEEDTKNSHDWQWINSVTKKFEDSEDVCLDFEQHILDLLLEQVMDELC